MFPIFCLCLKVHFFILVIFEFLLQMFVILVSVNSCVSQISIIQISPTTVCATKDMLWLTKLASVSSVYETVNLVGDEVDELYMHEKYMHDK